MILPSLVDQVAKLLAEGKLSQRKIAKLTGVSRGTIGAIASGNRHLQQRVRPPWEEEEETIAGPAERCPTCGAKVFLPCILCRTHRALTLMPTLKNAQRGRFMKAFPKERVLGLELKPDHFRRYEEVRRHRREEEIQLLKCGELNHGTR